MQFLVLALAEPVGNAKTLNYMRPEKALVWPGQSAISHGVILTLLGELCPKPRLTELQATMVPGLSRHIYRWFSLQSLSA